MQVREAIVAATVRMSRAKGSPPSPTAGWPVRLRVSLSSTKWHYATKQDILQAALQWTARHEAGRIASIALRLGDADSDPSAWAEGLAEWLIEQVTEERDVAIALYRLQIEPLGSSGASEVHRARGAAARAGRARARALAQPGSRHPARGLCVGRVAVERAAGGRAGRRVVTAGGAPAASGAARVAPQPFEPPADRGGVGQAHDLVGFQGHAAVVGDGRVTVQVQRRPVFGVDDGESAPGSTPGCRAC